MRESTREEVRRIARETAKEVVWLASSRTAISRAAQRTVAAVARETVEERLASHRVDEDRVRAIAEACASEVAAVGARKTLEDVKPSFLESVRDEVEKVFADLVPPVVQVNVSDAEPIRVEGHTHRVLPDVLTVLKARCHVLLVGPAGTGKSMLAKQAAEALGLEFQALSLGPTTPMSKIFGYYDAHGHYHDTPFRRAFEHGGLMLLDELDSGHPGLLAELNQALAIRVCAFADGMVTAHPDFRLVATANTYGTGGDRQYVGRQALDAATLDRFVVVDVPVDERLEERLVLAHAPSRREEARRVLDEVRRLRATAAEKRLPVMFSPRAGIDAARLLEAGATVEQAIRWRLVRGMSEAHRSALGIDA